MQKPVTRVEVWRAVIGCMLLATLFLSPALLTGRVLSPADLLFNHHPWQEARPPGWTRPSNDMVFDSVYQFEPWLDFSARRLHEGHLPLWNPDNMLGAPLIGNMQSAVFFPLNWPFFVWPDPAMLVLRAWLKLFLAALGVYLLARDTLRVNSLSASIAVITFTLGTFMTAWLLFPLTGAVMWLPWLWWATAKLINKPTPRSCALLAVLVAIHLLAGQPEMAYHMALVTGLFALYLIWQSGRHSLGSAAGTMAWWSAAYLLGAGVAAIQILPFLEYLTQSWVLHHRGSQSIPFWMPFQRAWTMFSPDLFGNPARGTWWGWPTTFNESVNYSGVVTMLLAPFAFFIKDKKQRRLAIFLGLIVILAAGVAYHWPIIADVALLVPLTNIVMNHRLVSVMQLGLGLLAALGFEALWLYASEQRRRVLSVLGVTVAMLMLLSVALPTALEHTYFGVPADNTQAQEVWRAGIVRAGVLIGIGGLLIGVAILLGQRTVMRFLFGLLPLVLLADLLQARIDYNPTIARESYFPDTAATRYLRAQERPFRTSARQGVFMVNTNLHYDVASVWGYDAIEPRTYHELMFSVPVQERERSTSGEEISPLFNLLNVRYLIVPPGGDPNYKIDSRQENSSGVTVGEIAGANRPGQTFIAKEDNLAQISVLGATHGGKARGRVIFHVKERPDAIVDLVTQELDASALPDNSYWTVTFPPIRQSQGKSFYFYLETPEARPGEAATLWYSTTDVYPEGTRTENGKAVGGDLAFITAFRLGIEEPQFERVAGGGGIASVYENNDSLPRAWIVHHVEVEPDDKLRALRLHSREFNAKSTALLKEPPPTSMPLLVEPDVAKDLVEISRYEAEVVEIKTQSSTPGLLILADQAFPGWEATVDGQSTSIITANYALRAVHLSAGTHTVRFDYRPFSFRVGAILACAAGLIIFLLALRHTPHQERR